MSKYTWKPSAEYTALTFLISVFIGLIVIFLIGPIAFFTKMHISYKTIIFIHVVTSLCVWIVLLCIPEDTEY